MASATASRMRTLDALRGLAAVSVVFIHTVFWSGAAYAPPLSRELALLIDVPVFFFLAGWGQGLRRRTPGEGAAAFDGLLRLYLDFALFCGAVVLLGIAMGRAGLHELAALLTLRSFQSPPFELVGGSAWFVPVYLCALGMLIATLGWREAPSRRRFFAIAFMAAVAVWIVAGLGRTVPFYLGIAALGWFIARRGFEHPTLRWLAALLGVLVAWIALTGGYAGGGNEGARLQQAKFPPGPLYLAASLPSLMLCVVAARAGWSWAPLEWIGRNAIWVYFAQGISGSLLYKAVAMSDGWPTAPRLAAMFALNLALALAIAPGIRRLVMPLRNRLMSLRPTRITATDP
ncbi:acyltransferase family protein [Roseateles sp. MS654]|uniref:acyltransferase family protein n=1 Tax=Roseateles sp. MS654 TaxID=3412685 RepID=UPI003C2C0E33